MINLICPVSCEIKTINYVSDFEFIAASQELVWPFSWNTRYIKLEAIDGDFLSNFARSLIPPSIRNNDSFPLRRGKQFKKHVVWLESHFLWPDKRKLSPLELRRKRQAFARLKLLFRVQCAVGKFPVIILVRSSTYHLTENFLEVLIIEINF